MEVEGRDFFVVGGFVDVVYGKGIEFFLFYVGLRLGVWGCWFFRVVI